MATLALNVKGLHERYGIFLGFKLAVAGGATLAITSDVISIFVIVMVTTITANDFQMLFMIKLNERPLMLTYLLMMEHKLIFLG